MPLAVVYYGAHQIENYEKHVEDRDKQSVPVLKDRQGAGEQYLEPEQEDRGCKRSQLILSVYELREGVGKGKGEDVGERDRNADASVAHPRRLQIEADVDKNYARLSPVQYLQCRIFEIKAQLIHVLYYNR